MLVIAYGLHRLIARICVIGFGVGLIVFSRFRTFCCLRRRQYYCIRRKQQKVTKLRISIVDISVLSSHQGLWDALKGGNCARGVDVIGAEGDVLVYSTFNQTLRILESDRSLKFLWTASV